VLVSHSDLNCGLSRVIFVLSEVKYLSGRDRDYNDEFDFEPGDTNIDEGLQPGHDGGESRNDDDDWGDDGDKEHPLSEAKREQQGIREQKIKEEEQERRKKGDEAQKALKQMEREAFRIAEQMIDALFNTYDLALKLKASRNEAWHVTEEFKNFNLNFHVPIVANFADDLANFLSHTLPFSIITQYPSTEPLRDKIISKMGGH